MAHHVLLERFVQEEKLQQQDQAHAQLDITALQARLLPFHALPELTTL